MDTFCFGSGQQKKKVNFNSQVKQTKENKLKQKESKYKLFTLLRHTCTFASTAGFYPDLEIQTGSTEYFSLRDYTFLQILLSSEEARALFSSRASSGAAGLIFLRAFYLLD